jgi:hypothetical protein
MLAAAISAVARVGRASRRASIVEMAVSALASTLVAAETAVAATKQEINGILLRIAAKYGTDFALWSDGGLLHGQSAQ